MKVRLVLVTLALCFALNSPAFAQLIIFDDGPTDGFTNALFIDGPNSGPFSQNISDGFVAPQSGGVGGLDFGIWVTTGLTPTTVTWWLGTSAFGSNISSGVSNNLISTFRNDSGFGYDVYDVHIDGLSGDLTAGKIYWLSLGNVNDSGGTQTDAWDVNDGPATCNFAVGGQNFGDCGTGGEAFTLYAVDPEPGTLVMFGGGILAAAGVLRRKVRL